MGLARFFLSFEDHAYRQERVLEQIQNRSTLLTDPYEFMKTILSVSDPFHLTTRLSEIQPKQTSGKLRGILRAIPA